MSQGGSETTPTPPVTEQGWRRTATAVLKRSGGISGMVVAAIPTIVFVVVNAVNSLAPALIATVLAAMLVFGWRLARRESLREAMVGLLIAGMGIAVAVYTGEAKGFFLPPILLCVVSAVVCIVSVLARRPLAGLLINRIVGGRGDWHRDRRLRRIYYRTTLLSAVINVLSFVLQIALYRANQTAWLAALHTVTGPMWAAVIIVTVVLGRRAITSTRGAHS